MPARRILTRLRDLDDVSGTPASGKSLVDNGAGGVVWTDVATQAELDAHASRHAVGGADALIPEAIGVSPVPIISGNWYPATNLTVSTPTNNAPRFVPLLVSRDIVVDRISCEVTTAGQAGSVIRLGIYTSSGGLPSALVLDAGTVTGDTVAIKEIIINQALTQGLYWLCAVTQLAATTPPIVRVIAGSPPHPVIGTTSNTSNVPIGYQSPSGSVAGALPSSAATPITTHNTIHRVIVRVV